jgi:hypothetical protein
MFAISAIIALVLTARLPNQAEGTLRAGDITIKLSHVRAHLHDNAEGLMDRKKELRILLTDREVPASSLYGVAFQPIWHMAMRGEVQGILLELDPTKPNEVHSVLLMKPKQKGASLMTTSLSVTGSEIFKGWKYTGSHVSGSVDRQKEAVPGGEMPSLSYTASFDSDILPEPKVTQDLKGAQAVASPQVKMLVTSADALTRGDFATVKKMASKQGAARLDEMITQAGPQAKALAKQFGTEMKTSLKKVKRVVVRGDRAIVIMPDGVSMNVILEGGVWKTDN